MKSINELFNKINRRHVYNIDNYVYLNSIKNIIKKRLTQLFIYIYRRKVYAFLIIFAIQKLYETNDSFIINLVLDFFVYRFRDAQIIHALYILNYNKLYFIDALNNDN